MQMVKSWHKYVELAAFADRITVSSVTGYSPYYLLHGTHSLLPFDLLEATLLVEGFHSGMSTSDLLALRIHQLHRHPQDLKQAADVLKQARFKSKQQFEKRYKHRLQKEEYKPGQLVLVRNSRLEATVTKFKTEPRYLGPYEVVDRSNRGTYTLKELDGAIHSERYAAFRIIPYVTQTDPEFQKILLQPDDDLAHESENDNSSSHKDLIQIQIPKNHTSHYQHLSQLYIDKNTNVV